MSARLATLRLLAVLAFRSIWTHKAKSLVVGSLMFFGTFLVVVGTALLDSVETSMKASIVSSLSGHLQLYSSEAKDPLALFGSGFMGADDIGEIEDVGPVKEAVEALPDVEAVVPMGIGMATLSNPGELDKALQDLREAVRSGDAEARDALAVKIREMAHELEDEVRKSLEVSTDRAKWEKALVDLAEVQGGAFWRGLAADPEPALQKLDVDVAPLAGDAQLVYLRYVGTDIPTFARHFDRMELVEGELPPAGQRGVLLSERFWERFLKNKVARDLDELKRKRDQGDTMAADPLLRGIASRLPGQYQRVTFQLSPEDAKTVEAGLRRLLPDVDGDLGALVRAFLAVDDATFDARYAQFYELIAPRIQLHPVDVGEVLTLRTFTKGGYLKAVNVKLWGVFRFEGLESSDIAGASNLLDLVSFRELYGKMTAAKREELAAIKEEVGVEAVDRASAEDALFGGGGLVEEVGEQGGFDEFADVDLKGQVDRLRAAGAAPYDPAELSRGLALNAAVVLKNPDRQEEAAEAIRATLAEQGLKVQVTSWQAASGLIGQFIIVVRSVLYLAIAIIFAVALVIINNSMIIATMERVSEIGTLRAMGAQRSVVLVMFLLETVLLGLVAGGAGGAAGMGLMAVLSDVGISAGGVDVLVFLFSGPRLYPTVGLGQLLIGVAAILVVSLASTFYPARIATRIQPVVAMQTQE